MNNESIQVTQKDTKLSGTLTEQQSEELVRQIEEYPVTEINDVFECDYTPMVMFNQKYPIELQMAIVNMVMDLAEYYNVEDTLSPKMALSFAKVIISEYKTIPIEALPLFFNGVKAGRYGKVYGKLSCADITQMFAQFNAEYWDAFYENKERENKKVIKETDDAFTDVERIERLKREWLGKPYYSPEEREKRDKIDAIRKETIKKNQHLYSTMSVDEADRTIDEAIKISLMAEGIFE